MKLYALAFALPLIASLLPPASAQTGPWTDGELLTVTSFAGSPSIMRIVPETGAAALLVTPQYFASGTTALVFDSFRGGLLANVSFAPDGVFQYRLWLVAHDGAHVALPGLTGSLRALCSAGDGRVFFIRHVSGSQGPKAVEYFDAGDQLRTLKDIDGVTDFKLEVEHLLYHAPTNSLIGSSTSYYSATDCAAAGSSLYCVPLSADGLQVAGPVTCVPTSNAVNTEDIMSLDHLPDGDVLVTLATGAPFSGSRLLRLHPATMTVSGWANPAANDINGGVWSARLGKAVIHVNFNAAELRTFSPGASGPGTLLPTSLPLPGGGGYGPAATLYEVDANGPACDGFQCPYGTGLAGKGGLQPKLVVLGCPDIGSVFTLSMSSVVGGASGVLFVGLAPAEVPFKGGTFLVGSLATQFAVTVGGAPGTAGAGSMALPAVLSSPALTGVNIYLQAGFADAAAIQGVSLSNGVRVQGD